MCVCVLESVASSPLFAQAIVTAISQKSQAAASIQLIVPGLFSSLSDQSGVPHGLVLGPLPLRCSAVKSVWVVFRVTDS